MRLVFRTDIGSITQRRVFKDVCLTLMMMFFLFSAGCSPVASQNPSNAANSSNPVSAPTPSISYVNH